jgi:4-amino-4-deoxy-L-arabinose transferase-like glycosyltransferase
MRTTTDNLPHGLLDIARLCMWKLSQPVAARSKLWRLGLVLTIGMFIIMALAQSLATPVFEASDEQRHYAYARYLVNYHTLPPRNHPDIAGTRFNYGYTVGQIAGHPPLYYLAVAFLTALVPNADNTDPFTTFNPFVTPANETGLELDNHSLYLHGPEGTFPFQGTALAVHLSRLISIITGAVTLLGVYAIGRAVVPARPGIALLATLLVASIPGIINTFSVLSNDVAVILFTTLSVWIAVRIAREGPTLRLAILGGIFAGLTTLSKLNGIWISGIVWLALLCATYTHRRDHSLKAGWLALLLSIGTWLVITGWWFAWGAIQNGDPFGITIHALAQDRGVIGLKLPTESLLTSLERWDRTIWYSVNSTLIQGPYWIYQICRYLFLAGLAGAAGMCLTRLITSRDSKKHSPTITVAALQYLLLVLVTLLAVAGAVFWWLLYDVLYGRYVYPGLASAEVLVALGYAWWLDNLRKSHLRQVACWGFAIVVVVLTQRVAIYTTANTIAALSPHYIISPVPKDVIGTELIYLDPIDWETPVAEVVGYRVLPQDLHVGNAMYADICWKSTGYMRQSFPYSMQLVGPDDYRPGTRNSYHGLGSYPIIAWKNGETFCDSTSLFIAQTIDKPRAYKLVVTLFPIRPPEFKPESPLPVVDGNGHPVYPVIGRVRVAPDPHTVPAVTPTVSLGGVAGLAGTTIELRPDDVLSVTIRWVALGTTNINAHVYLHLLDSISGRMIAQDDHEPDAGWFPTNYWQKGDVIDDHFEFKLPPDIDISKLNLRLGMYDVQTQVRLPAVVVTTNERLRDDEVTIHP